MEFKEEAQIEQFRSVIAVGASALKSALLINGGGVIAVLTFLGNQKDQQGFVWFVSAMFVMCGGISLAVFGNILAYIAQIKHLNQLKSKSPGDPAGTPWGYAAVTLIVISVVAFIGGVILASFGFVQKI
ncbi:MULTISPECIES: hypothetical protein [unclassified Marinimicrobium]|jgi:uncharacterized membrane protein YidH (DUF202 family)|uniref:hypothetical protein n=1 Tax=unclassified Marinimicrobium TaxID=2632100 RepID=UPI000C575EE4|nr:MULTISPECIES: hypothetical protein [unclassified Marinimicrobium]MAN52938.1 hypothetical protein [Marinimicrobium sp.]|tara:strand:+ start:83 stop:469 length:387 start_codon:yes stop_codon:yes gene_type:complete